MLIDRPQLAALSAVLALGSFDRAAAELNVTSSAISQRVRALEERLGLILIIRGQPCRPTEAGRRLLRHAEEVALMEAALAADLGRAEEEGRPVLRIAVNADSLATWFIAAMARVDGVLFDLVIDDQDHSADWLRRGEVMAAIASQPGGVQGCGHRPLGALRYRATASPAFAARWFPHGISDRTLARAPSLTFDRKDRLQSRWLRQVTGQDLTPPTHWLPSSQAFVDGALAGLGWGMNPEMLVAPYIEEGRLVDLAPSQPLSTPLYWVWSRAAERSLAPFARAVIETAAERLADLPA